MPTWFSGLLATQARVRVKRSAPGSGEYVLGALRASITLCLLSATVRIVLPCADKRNTRVRTPVREYAS
jgi:hypothetical protein